MFGAVGLYEKKIAEILIFIDPRCPSVISKYGFARIQSYKHF